MPKVPLHSSLRRNEERDQGGALAPPIRSKIGKIRSKMGAKICKIWPFWGVVIHENKICGSLYVLIEYVLKGKKYLL